MNNCPICAAARGLCPQCAKRFYPGRLIQARRARGMSRKALAVAAGFSCYKLTEWESGRQRPTENQILCLGAALGFPRVFFSRQPLSSFSGPVWVCSKGGCQVLDQADPVQ